MIKLKGISLKLFLIVLIPILGLTIVGGFGLISMHGVKNQVHSVTQINIPQKSFSAEIKAHIPEVISQMQRAALNYDNKSIKANAIEMARSHMEKVRISQTDLLALHNHEELQHILERFNGKLDELDSQQSMILDQLEADSDEALKGAKAALQSKELSDLQSSLNSNISDLDKYVSDDLNLDSNDAIKRIEILEIIIAVVFVLSLILSFIVTFVFAKNFVNRLEGLNTTIKTLADSTQKQSTQLHESAQIVANGSTESAAALEESSASLEVVLGITKKTNESAKIAADLAKNSLTSSENGKNQISQLIKRMDDLRESSKQIEGITEVIDDLAFQTNLLALNASVEAARAGELGRGFAVVAEAVRSLANRSSSSAKEISELISRSAQHVQAGQADANASGIILGEIVSQNEKLKNLIEEIAMASNEQESSLHQVSQAITLLDQNAQNNAQSSTQVLTSSNLLLTESESLMGQVSILEEFIDGKQMSQL